MRDRVAPRPSPGDPLAGRAVAGRRGGGETRLCLLDGPELIVPFHGRPVGEAVMVTVRADDILLARGPIAGLSARNLIVGTVERIISHGAEAEVLVRTGGVVWIVSVV